jgi:hypothetical protein
MGLVGIGPVNYLGDYIELSGTRKKWMVEVVVERGEGRRTRG